MVAKFSTTCWSVVVAAGDTSDPQHRSALRQLSELYWQPAYAFVRSQGVSHEEAEDLTQSYFVAILEKNYFSEVSAEKGSFRAFVLVSLRHFIFNAWDKDRAQKRFPGKPVLSLDSSISQGRRQSIASGSDPDTIFECRAALAISAKVLSVMEAECRSPESRARFLELKPYLTDHGHQCYKDTARTLGTTERAVNAAVRRLRKRYGRVLRAVVEPTVVDPDDVDDEIYYLLKVLKRTKGSDP